MAPQVVSITVFPDPVPSGATAIIHINAQSPAISAMTFGLTASTGPSPQPTADPSVWTWTAP